MLARRIAPLQRRQGLAARIALPVLKPVAPDRDVQPLGQGIDHRNADPVQAAGGLIALARKLAARMQHGHDHFKGGLVGVFGVGIDGNAAAIIAHDQGPVGFQPNLNELGVTGHGLVHGIIKHFGEQVVQGALICAANIHARPLAHRL